MENLFGYKAAEQQKNKKGQAAFEAPKYIQIIDPRKAQNLAILLKALNVTTDEVCEAVLDGNCFTILSISKQVQMFNLIRIILKCINIVKEAQPYYVKKFVFRVVLRPLLVNR